MANNTNSFSSFLESKSSKFVFGRVGLVALFIALTLVYLLICNILSKIGLGPTQLIAMVVFVPILVFLISAFTNRITGSWGQEDLGQFTRAGGTADIWTNSMAGTAEWVSLIFLITLISALSATNHDAIAIIIGLFLGFALASILILPRITNQNLLTVSKIIVHKPLKSTIIGQLLQFAITTIIILCTLAFLVAQVETGGHMITLHFPINYYWAGFLLLFPVIISAVFGGLKSLTIANMLLVWLIGAAILVPLIWLSFEITGNPIPQLSFGNGALQPILQLEEQLVQINSGELGDEFEEGNFSQLSGFSSFFATVICTMAATSVMPQLYSRIGCSSGISTRIRTTSWMMLFIALLVSILPAFVIFMKFEVYDDLIGLPLSRIEDEIAWLLNWANIEGGRLVRICGHSITDFQALILACGNDPEYVLIPTDIEISPLVTLFGIHEITGMPIIISALTFAGLLTASATTAAILLMVIVNSVSEFLFDFEEKNSLENIYEPIPNSTLSLSKVPIAEQKTTPIAKHLFVSRLMLLAIPAGVIWMAGNLAVPTANLTLWALFLLAGTVFPAMIMVLWLRYITQLGVLAGIVGATSASIFLIISIEYGIDGVFQNGDEKLWKMPFGNEPARLLNSAIFIIPINLCIAAVVSVLDRTISKRLRARKQTRQPIAE